MPVFNENKHLHTDYDKLAQILETVYRNGYFDTMSIERVLYVVAESKARASSLSDCISRLAVVLHHEL